MIKNKSRLSLFIALLFCTGTAFLTMTAVAFTYAVFPLGSDDVDLTATPLFTEDGLSYYQIDTTKVAVACLDGLTGGARIFDSSSVIEVPSDVNGYNVTAVAHGGFRYCKAGTIKLPESITEIGSEAFAYCTNLTTFKLPHAVTVIPPSAFLDCRKMTTFFYTAETVEYKVYHYEDDNWVQITPDFSYGETPASHSFIKVKNDYTYLDKANKDFYIYNATNEQWVDKNAGTGEGVIDSFPHSSNNYDYFICYRTVYPELTTNETVTHIKDNAFNSCVALTQFNFPKNLQIIEKCAFQRCSSLTRLYLPTGHNLEIESYAFSDCSSLSWVYFEQNLKTLGSYAFAHANSTLTFHYGVRAGSGETAPALGNDNTKINNKFSPANGFSYATNWRQRYLATNKTNNSTDRIPFETDEIQHVYADNNEYPEIIFSIDKGPIKLDCVGTGGTADVIDSAVTQYATIRKWTKPAEYTTNYYEPGGKLTIPPTVKIDGVEYPVKVIGPEAFRLPTNDNINDITEITFANNLVQICKRAFYGYVNISNLDFSAATDLIEVSNGIFTDRQSNNVANTAMTGALNLSPSIKYIGKYAFYNFHKVNGLSFGDNSELLVLGGYAFGRIGETLGKNNGACIEVTLPNTLNDSVAKRIKINYKENDDYNEQNWAAVGPYAFGARADSENTAIISITMEECDDDLGYTTSLAPNAFARSANITRFVSNKNLYFVGADCFKNCNKMREIFLSTNKTKNLDADTNPYPWGTKDENGTKFDASLFTGNSAAYPDLIIYIDGDSVPGKLNQVFWHTENGNSFAHEMKNETGAGNSFSRSEIPLIFNAQIGQALYWAPGNNDNNINSDDYGTFVDAPASDADYNGTSSGHTNGTVVFAKIKVNSVDKYEAVKYYYDKTKNAPLSTIDLTKILTPYDGEGDDTRLGVDVPGNIVQIGPEAFASPNNEKHRGLYFVLPNTITTIDERAFYRKAGATDSGVRIVTYRSSAAGNPIVGKTSPAQTFANIVSNWGTDGYKGYCSLPDSVVTIGKDAFYDNVFETVEIGSGLNYVGKSAFYTHYNATTELKRLSVSGTTKLYVKSNDSWGEITPYLSGNGEPASNTGDENDYYIDLLNYNVYKKVEVDSVLTWVLQSNVSHGTSTKSSGGENGDIYIKHPMFDDAGNGLYCFDEDHQILLYQSQKDSTTTLKIADGTIAVGMHALACTSYTNITLNQQLTYIFGGGFQHNTALQEVIVPTGSNLQYIGAYSSSIDEAWNNNSHFDIIDFPRMKDKDIYKESQGSAFKDCTALTTFDFSKTSNLVKIGPNSFNGCYSMNNTNGGTAYTYKKYANSNITTPTATTVVTNGYGIIDLSNNTDLISIGASAFEGCTGVKNTTNTGIKYFHLPTPNDSANFTISGDLSEGTASTNTAILPNNSITILVGETAQNANYSSPTANTYRPTLQNHYKLGCFGSTTGSNLNTVYYHATSYSDLIDNSTEGSTKYWTKVGDDYYLFEDLATAKAYFAS